MTQNDPLLLVVNDYINEEAAKTVAGSDAFLLLKTDKNILSYPGIVEVAQHRIGAELYSIIRKVFKYLQTRTHKFTYRLLQSNDVEPLYVKAKADNFNIKDLSKDSLAWVSELKSKISSLKVAEQNVYLIISSVPTDGVYNFSRALTTQEFARVRYKIHTKLIVE